jgi:ankyrin repeat protein
MGEVIMKRKLFFLVSLPVALLVALTALASPLHQWRQKAFCTAAWLGKPTSMKVLLALGANVHQCSAGYVNPLTSASESGKADAITLLLNHGADVNQRDQHAWTPLMYAAGAGQTSSVRLLILHGADVNAVGSSGSALQIAALVNHADIVAVLRDAGATR